MLQIYGMLELHFMQMQSDILKSAAYMNNTQNYSNVFVSVDLQV